MNVCMCVNAYISNSFGCRSFVGVCVVSFCFRSFFLFFRRIQYTGSVNVKKRHISMHFFSMNTKPFSFLFDSYTLEISVILPIDDLSRTERVLVSSFALAEYYRTFNSTKRTNLRKKISRFCE